MPTYQTGYGNYYRFSFEEQSDGSIRVYILSQPDYAGRDTSCTIIHRLKDGERHYICREPQPKTLAEAKAVAAGWSTRTDRYILTGRLFNEK